MRKTIVFLLFVLSGLLLINACLDTSSSGGSDSPPATQSEPDDQGEDSSPPPDETPTALTAEECAQFSLEECAQNGCQVFEAQLTGAAGGGRCAHPQREVACGPIQAKECTNEPWLATDRSTFEVWQVESQCLPHQWSLIPVDWIFDTPPYDACPYPEDYEGPSEEEVLRCDSVDPGQCQSQGCDSLTGYKVKRSTECRYAETVTRCHAIDIREFEACAEGSISVTDPRGIFWHFASHCYPPGWGTVDGADSPFFVAMGSFPYGDLPTCQDENFTP